MSPSSKLMDFFFSQIQTSVNKYHQSFRKHNAMCRRTVILSESGAQELICGGSLKRHRLRTGSPSSHPLQSPFKQNHLKCFFLNCGLYCSELSLPMQQKVAIKGALLGIDWIDIRDRAVGDAVWRCWFMETRNQRPSVPCLHTQPWPLCSPDVHT